MKERIISLALSVSILLSMAGCTRNNKNNQGTKRVPSEYYSYEQPENTMENTIPETTVEETIPEIDLQSYLDALNLISPEYNYSEFYFNDSQIEQIIEESNNLQQCESTTMLSYEELYNVIEENNQYTEDSPFCVSATDDNLKKMLEVQVAIKYSLKNIYETQEVTIEDVCHLKDVKIVVGNLNQDKDLNDGVILGMYTSNENKITIDYFSTFNSWDLFYKEKMDFFEYLIKVVQHELNHVRQYICDCRKEKGQQNETLKSFIFTENSDLGYATFGTIIEASAESQLYYNNENVMYINNSYNYTYLDERELQCYLLLLGMFKENFSLDEYYKAINDSNLQKIFKIFNLQSKEELKTFYNIMYSLDTKNGWTPLTVYLIENEKETYREIEIEIGDIDKIYIFREVIKDLIKRINAGDITFEESIYLYNYVKCYIVADSGFMNEDRVKVYGKDFIDLIVTIENQYYSFISKYYAKSFNDIESVMTDFHFYFNFSDLLSYKDLQSGKNDESICNIVSKFPIIYELNFTNPHYVFELNDFNENNELKLTRTLE